MKGRSLMLTALLAIAAGGALIFAYNSISSTGIVVTGGVLFIVAGIINMLTFVGDDKRTGSRSSASLAFGWVTSAAGVILGLAMLLFQSTFAALVPFMFGVLVLFAALFQFFVLAIGSRPTRLPGWLYVVPLLIVGAAVYLFIQKEYFDSPIIVAVTGGAFVVFGLGTLFEGIMIGNNNRKARRKSADQSPAPESETEAGSTETEPDDTAKES